MENKILIIIESLFVIIIHNTVSGAGKPRGDPSIGKIIYWSKPLATISIVVSMHAIRVSF